MLAIDIHSSTDVGANEPRNKLVPSYHHASSTDLYSPTQLVKLIAHETNATTANVCSRVLHTLFSRAPKYQLTCDAWLRYTLDTIREYRDLKEAWDGEHAAPPSSEALSAAEMLAAFLAPIPEARRPQLSVGADGLPSFARNKPDFYLHLIVEPKCPTDDLSTVANLTWYSIRDGEEEFRDSVPFTGRKLPERLRNVIEE